MIATGIMLVLAIILLAVGLLGALESGGVARWRYWAVTAIGLALLLATLAW